MTRTLRWMLAAAAVLTAAPASAMFHTFRIDQIFSNADGTIQFIVLHESLGMDGENMLGGHALTSTQGATSNTYTFPRDLPGGGGCDAYGCSPAPTADRRVLIGTAGFAALGIVTPDYTIPNGFILPAGTLNYAQVDLVTYTSLPTDGVSAIDRTGASVPNQATNFAGQSASVVVAAANYQGLWWNAPANSESGWGVNLAHQGDTIFASWFTYDMAGHGWWLVVTANKTGPNTYSGKLYSTRGPAFSATPWDPAMVYDDRAGHRDLHVQRRQQRHLQLRDRRSQSDQEHHARSIRPAAQLQLRDGGRPDHRDQLPGSLVEQARELGVGMGDQPEPRGRHDLRHLVHLRPRWLGVVARGDREQDRLGCLHRRPVPYFRHALRRLRSGQCRLDQGGHGDLTFADGNNATLSYTVQVSGMATPVTQAKPITREIFTAPGTACH